MDVHELYLEDKSAFRCIRLDAGSFHIAWEMEDGAVFVVERIMWNWPSLTVNVFKTMDDYSHAFRNCYFDGEDEDGDEDTDDEDEQGQSITDSEQQDEAER